MTTNKAPSLLDMEDSIVDVRQIGQIMAHMIESANEIEGGTLGWLANMLMDAGNRLQATFNALQETQP